jgi:hypothetical protein
VIKDEVVASEEEEARVEKQKQDIIARMAQKQQWRSEEALQRVDSATATLTHSATATATDTAAVVTEQSSVVVDTGPDEYVSERVSERVSEPATAVSLEDKDVSGEWVSKPSTPFTTATATATAPHAKNKKIGE